MIRRSEGGGTAALPSLTLPDFDTERPFSLLDGAFGVARTKLAPLHLEGQAQANVHSPDETSGDAVLERFSNGDALVLGVLPKHDAGLDGQYGVLEINSEHHPLSTLPRSWKELEYAPPIQIAGPSKPPRDLERVTSQQISARSQWRDCLVKGISLSDFEEEPSDDDTVSVHLEKSSLHDKEERKAGWQRPSTSHLPSLLVTAQGQASIHYSWDEEKMAFVPRRTKHSANSAEQRPSRKRRLSDATVERSPTTGEEGHRSSDHGLIAGLSAPASSSIAKRFLTVGALQRRLQWRVQAIRDRAKGQNRSTSEPELPAEAFALASGLADTLSWLVAEVDRVERSSGVQQSKDGSTLNAWAQLAEIETLLESLAEMVKCGMGVHPPFVPLFEPTTSSGATHPRRSKKRAAQVLSLVHAHLTAAVESCAYPLLIGVLRYLLDLTSTAWRKEVVNYIGWPCGEQDRLPDEVEVQMLLGREARQQHNNIVKANKTADRCEPWAGIEVEWGWDERGELDVGYILRPVRLPTFLPISHARDLLEAGRALRLLQRAAPASHPLLLLRERMRSSKVWQNKRAVEVPTWRWDSQEIGAQDKAVRQCIRDLRREIAAWRRYSGRSAGMIYLPDDRENVRPNSPNVGSQRIPTTGLRSLKDLSEQFSWEAVGQNIGETLSRFDQTPSGMTLAETGRPAPHDVSPVLPFIRAAQQHEDEGAGNVNYKISDVSLTTMESLIAPMLQWSRLINASLISVFFRDLHLGEYLDVCCHYLLLGNQSFAASVAEVLFDDGINSDQTGAPSDMSKGTGVGQLLCNDPSWPPAGSELPNALNTVVLESVASSRLETTELAKHRRFGSDESLNGTNQAAKHALLDLDDRLSFAIVKPPKGQEGWLDRRSIEALDWLTLSFQPPPLIVPLITLQAQLSYQRLFKFLLRLMRVDTVLKGVFRKLMFRQQSCSPLPAWMDSWDIQCASRFRYEAHHFVTVLLRYSTDVVITRRWQRFRNRLSALRRSAESQEDVDEDLERAQSASEASEDGQSAMDTASEVGGAATMDDAATEAGDESTAMPSQFELKDVFSIAAYHEQTLDRMLSGCFLKRRQGAITMIIVDMFNLILAFGHLLQQTDGSCDDLEAGKTLGNLLARFQSKSRLLLHALELVGQRALDRGDTGGLLGTPQRFRLSREPPKAAPTRQAPGGVGQERRATASVRHAAVDAEIARQEAETLRDLDQLERDERKENMGDLEMVHALIAALQGR